jgi:hypothetical protein
VIDVAESGASAVRVLACVVTVAVGMLVVGGCLLSIYFEVVGFGRPRDTGVRPGVVAPLVVGVAAGVLVPAGVCVWAAGRNRRLVTIVALVVAVVTAVLMVGILGLG